MILLIFIFHFSLSHFSLFTFSLFTLHSSYGSHINGQRFNHATVYLVQFLNLLSHLTRLLIYLLNGANLLADISQLQFVYGGNTSKSAVQILHFLAVGTHASSLSLYTSKNLCQFCQFLGVVQP